MRAVIVQDFDSDIDYRVWELKRLIEQFGVRVDTVPESDHTLKATKEIFERERLEAAYKRARDGWIGSYDDPYMNYRDVVEFMNSTEAKIMIRNATL